MRYLCLFMLATLIFLGYSIRAQVDGEDRGSRNVSELITTEKTQILVEKRIIPVNKDGNKTEEDTGIPGLNVAARLGMFNREAFAQLLISSRLFEILYQNDKPYTLFTPNNAIVNEFTKNVTSFAEIRRFAEYHIYRGNFESLDFQDGQRVTSYDNNKAFLNRLYSKVKKRMRIWVQGVEVETTVAKSGKSVIHLINGYIENPTETLFEYLESSGGYKIVMDIFKKYRLYFQFPYGVTFFAPLDKAFENLPSKYREELFNDDVKIRMLIRNHLISRPMCRGRLFHRVGWTRVVNNVGNTLQLYQDLFNPDASYVNSAAVVTSEAVVDGWVYGISDLLLPEINRKLLEELRFRECHTFLEHLINTGHMQKLSNLLEVRTIFAPTDKAFERLSNGTKERMINDKEFLQTMISFHVTYGKHLKENLPKIKYLNTAADDSRNKKIRLYFGGQIGRVQRSEITEGNRFALNGVIHIIDRVLIPPERTTFEIIDAEKNLRIFNKYYKQLNSSFKEILNNPEQGYTIFIPSNRALKTYFQVLKTNTEMEAIQKLNQVIWRHITLTPSWIKRSPNNVVKLKLRTLYQSNIDGNREIIEVKIPSKKSKGFIKIPQYNAQLLTTNQQTFNGTVHIVDQVFADEFKKISDGKLKFNKNTWKKLQARWTKNKVKPTTSTTKVAQVSKHASTRTETTPSS